MSKRIFVVNSYGDNGVYYHEITMAFTSRKDAISFAKDEVAVNEDNLAIEGKHYRTIHNDENHWYIFEVGNPNDNANHHKVEIVECILCDRKI